MRSTYLVLLLSMGLMLGSCNPSNENEQVYWDNGKMKAEGRMVNGKKEGRWRLWDSLGHLEGEYEYSRGQLDGLATLFDSSGVREQRCYVNGEKKGYMKKTIEGMVSQGEMMGPKELPPFRAEYIKLLTQDSVLKAYLDYPFEINVPGVPYMCITVAATKATLRKGEGTQFILTPNGKGETCINLTIHMANGEITNGYGPACYSVTNE